MWDLNAVEGKTEVEGARFYLNYVGFKLVEEGNVPICLRGFI